MSGQEAETSAWNRLTRPPAVTYRPTDYDDFFAKVAKAIGIVGLEIRRTVDESNGTHVMGIVSTQRMHVGEGRRDATI